MSNKFIIYSDGSCSPNPGLGGWAYLLYHDNDPTDIFHDSGSGGQTTNNRMELLAAINSLNGIPHDSNIDMFLDSQYVINGITKWIKNWKSKDFKNIKNDDLWKELDKKVSNFNINWYWVKAHDVNEHNNFVDQLAQKARKLKK